MLLVRRQESMGLVSKYVRNRWGCETEFTERYVGVVLAGSAILAPNSPDRFAITLQNMGANIAYVSVNSGVGPLAGIQLAANGGLIGYNANDDGELSTRQFYGIGAGASTIYVAETIGIVGR